MDKIKIPPFEGYDKGPRWEASTAQAVAFEDGATFAYVNHDIGFGWYTRTLCTSECGDDELTFHFATAEEAVAHVNQVYLDLQARKAEYVTDEKLLSEEELADILSAAEFADLWRSPCEISGVCPYGAEFGIALCAYCGEAVEGLSRYLDGDE